MKYIFVLGRDSEIASLEVVSLLKQAEFDFELLANKPQYLLIDLKEKVNIKALISRLAGTIRISQVMIETFQEDGIDFEDVEIYLPSKFNYLIADIDGDQKLEDKIEVAFKRYCKRYKLKAVGKSTQGELIASPAKYISWKIDQGIEILSANVDGKIYLAKSVAAADPDIFLIKDNDRPARKFTHGTSFRLASMMVNILDTPIGHTVIDPFCGTGTFLIEGMIKGYNMIGVDNDPELIRSAKENLAWAKGKFNLNSKFELITSDSTKQTFEADGCVFEPYMGEFLKKLPSLAKAQKSMQELESFYLKIFDNLAKHLRKGSRIVCILPYFVTYDGKRVYLSKEFFQKLAFKHLNLEKEYSLNLKNPIHYHTPSGSLIGRELHVLG